MLTDIFVIAAIIEGSSLKPFDYEEPYHRKFPIKEKMFFLMHIFYLYLHASYMYIKSTAWLRKKGNRQTCSTVQNRTSSVNKPYDGPIVLTVVAQFLV